MKSHFLTFAIIVMLGSLCLSIHAEIPIPPIERSIPTSGNNPGNVFLEGEEVTVSISQEVIQASTSWRMLNDYYEKVAEGSLTNEQNTLDLGELGIGWYRVELLNEENELVEWTTCAVLAKLKEPIPMDSPICVDGALSWFSGEDIKKQKDFARLASLAGVNWIRDRLRWRDIQPASDTIEAVTVYNEAARIQNQAGLKVLQVFHDTPRWAVEEESDQGRFVDDLRVVYQFGEQMAQHFEGTVQAWEPWNEANASDFGGHTADEMCTYQKAAYLGFKAGNPEVIVGMNAYAGTPTNLHTRNVIKNETWPYFDTYNIHSYDWPESYDQLWQPVHEASCGKPIWLTESDRGMEYVTEEPWFEHNREDLIRKAQFMAQSYASSLFAGCKRHFHFILGHYYESRHQVQFGLLRRDLTPRPAYVALAALGRMLAGAKSLGRWMPEDEPLAHIYAFRSYPDGEEQDVLVVWAEEETEWSGRGATVCDNPLPSNLKLNRIVDYLGREREADMPEQLTSEPLFLCMPPDTARSLPLEKKEERSLREGEVSPIVLQLSLSPDLTKPVQVTPWSIEHEHFVSMGQKTRLPLSVYNFSEQSVQGEIVVEHLPEGWEMSQTSWEVELDPMERHQWQADVLVPQHEVTEETDTWILLRGEFGNQGRPVLAFRLITQEGEGYKR